MKEEYIIINRTAIHKRIEELERQRDEAALAENEYAVGNFTGQIYALYELISSSPQSTPLIPILQKTWNTAYIDAMSIDEETYKPLFFEDYISNLKLDI